MFIEKSTTPFEGFGWRLQIIFSISNEFISGRKSKKPRVLDEKQKHDEVQQRKYPRCGDGDCVAGHRPSGMS
jgi:hypothetical protein